MPVHNASPGRHRTGACQTVLTVAYPAAPTPRAAERTNGRHRSASGSGLARRTIPRWGAVLGLILGLMMVAVAQAPAVQQGRALARLEQRVVSTSSASLAPARAMTLIVAPKAPNPRVLLDRATRSAQRDPQGAARVIAAQSYGWTGSQFTCLDRLWTRESAWNYRAQNPYSGAYGIPQALPGSKMASVGSDWATNPVTQIKWGLGYIESRYGSPCSAWGHSQSSGWY
ncbi:MAG: hypothetical protein ABJA34_13845 [Pseudonocardiales bacterium]